MIIDDINIEKTRLDAKRLRPNKDKIEVNDGSKSDISIAPTYNSSIISRSDDAASIL